MVLNKNKGERKKKEKQKRKKERKEERKKKIIKLVVSSSCTAKGVKNIFGPFLATNGWPLFFFVLYILYTKYKCIYI